MSIDEKGRLTMSVQEAAKALGIGRNTAYELIRQKKLPSIRLGKRIVVSKSALERLIEGETGMQKGSDNN